MKEYLDSVICCLLTFPWGLTVILLAAAVLGAAVLFFARRKIWFLTPLHLLIFGTFLSATIYFVPFYSAELSHWQTFFVSVQHALRLFALDGDFIADGQLTLAVINPACMVLFAIVLIAILIKRRSDKEDEE